MALRISMLLTSIFFSCSICFAQKKGNSKSSKISKALAQHLYYSLPTDSADILLALRPESVFAPRNAAPYRLIYRYQNFLTVRMPAAEIAPFLSGTNTVFADLVKQAKEELTTGYLDPAVNKLNYVRARFPSITGDSITASIKEQQFDTADIDYKGRYINSAAGAPAVTTHASIMATALAGAGNSSPFAKGAAPAAHVTSTSFASLLPEPDAYYKLFKISIQNHSYGTAPENYYGIEAAAYDQSVAANPTLVHVASAGNAGTAAGTGPYAGLEGWSNLTGNFKMAKNAIVVGAIDSFYRVAPASSRGPAFDGRVKPELVAFGEDGSSGAAALVSGTAALVQQAYRNLKNRLPPASLVKAVLLNSADAVDGKELSYTAGYGSLNGYNAVKTVLHNSFFEDSIRHGVLKKFVIAVLPNTARLKITLCWTDTPAAVHASKALVNDLDAVLQNNATGETWLPWVLNGAPHTDSLQEDAERKRDTLNNTERLTVDNPAPGNYSLEITGNNVTTAAQVFAIAYQINTAGHFEWTAPTAQDAVSAGQTAVVRWQTTIPGSGAIEYRMGDGDWTTLADNINLSAGYAKWLAPDTLCTARLRMRFSNTSPVVSDTFVVSKAMTVKTGFACNDSLLLYWNNLQVSQYRIYNLGSSYMEPVATATDTMVVFKTDFHPSLFYSVAPIVDGREGLRSAALNYKGQGADCYFRSFYMLSQSGSGAAFSLLIGTYYNIASVAFQKQLAGSYTGLQTITDPRTTAFTFSDGALQQGANIYRIRIVLKNGATLYSEALHIYHFTDASVVIYPNPALQNTSVNVITNLAGRVRIAIFNTSGQLMQEQSLSGLINKMSLAPLPKGLYFIRITEDAGTRYTRKLVVY